MLECRSISEPPFGALFVKDSNLMFDGSEIPGVVAGNIRYVLPSRVRADIPMMGFATVAPS